ncbi:hypothetical protein FKM82_013887 [Ascaphus truei]
MLATVYIDLAVLVPVLKPILQINNSVPVERSPVMLTCTVKNGTAPIEYIWQRHVSQEGTFVVAEGAGNLVILTAANRSHIGWYTCTVKNEVNEETSDRSYLDVMYGPDEPIINIQPFAISQNGFAANEQDEITLTCLASSNPPCHYVWFYNNSQIYSGQVYVISRILRSQTGMYTCLAQNNHLKTRTQLTISLTVFYLPEGLPMCTAIAHNNYKEVALWCTWDGGFPLAQLRWLKSSEEDSEMLTYSNATRIKRGTDILNGSTCTCMISHPALDEDLKCRTTVSVPKGGPKCSAVATKQNEFVMLTCEWAGGLPRIMLEWNNKQIGDSKESSNIHVLKSNVTYNGKLFTCTALHPMNTELKECNVKLEAPSLDTYEKEMSILEGNYVKLTCYLKQANPTSEIFWYDNKNKEIVPDSQKYGILQENGWSNLTMREAEWNIDSGKYRCLAVNAVGNASISIMLQIKKYPTPPNVTISKLIYSRQRTEVDLEWMTQGAADPPFNAYPAVIGAAIAGMLVAAVASLLVFQYIVRNRENNPRLHDMFFRPAPAETRENIRTPEDAETAADLEEGADNMEILNPTAGISDIPSTDITAGVTAPTSTSNADVPLSQLSVADLPDDAPVNVTITVTATP